MKIHVDIDCTPDEARRFLGLPDVTPMQTAVMKELQNRMLAGLQAMEPEQLMQTWMQGVLPAGLQSWDQMQKAFWTQMGTMAAGSGASSDAGTDDKTS
ncbi:DUF6489 family protein [Algihabitans albus]|uniref:DUF6489 family protein n=1 Tax=Algihabitans albus TaxID=2164067 RepID=UPI000E5D7FF1|nr:DUF6489 family protein [Algihabitans albus]